MQTEKKSKGVLAMKHTDVKKLVLASLMAALTCMATMVIEIPSPANGYVNLGDCIVLLSGWLLGPWYGAAAAGIGSMMADIFAGYAYYAPGTLVIKGLMGFLSAVLYRVLYKKLPKIAMVTSGIAAEALMVAGYFIYAALFLGYGAMAGNIGGGGLGAISLMRGHGRGQTLVLYVAVIILVVLVQIIQSVGTALCIKTDKRITHK